MQPFPQTRIQYCVILEGLSSSNSTIYPIVSPALKLLSFSKRRSTFPLNSERSSEGSKRLGSKTLQKRGRFRAPNGEPMLFLNRNGYIRNPSLKKRKVVIGFPCKEKNQGVLDLLF